jgi:archaeosortase A (PGF-CTERM-specific)
MVGPLTDALAWVVVGTFATSALLERRSRRDARRVAALGWALFAAFWLLLVPHFAFVQRSYIEGVGAAVAVPASAYTGFLVLRRRPGLLTLSRAVAVMGVLYLPFMTVPALQRFAIETTTNHGALLMETLGYDPAVTAGEEGYRSRYVIEGPEGVNRATPVLLACSGIGSIAVVSGLVLSVGAGTRRKAAALAVVVPLIYALNIVRVAFITVAYGRQWFKGPLVNDIVLPLFGGGEAHMVPYLVSDRIIAQSVSVVVLVAITLGLLRVLPELTTILQEALYVFTGREIELGARFA